MHAEDPLLAANLPAAQLTHAFVVEPIESNDVPAKQLAQDEAPVET